MEAGFRTVRRFNDAIRARYGRTPSDLRRNPDALAAERDGYVARLSYRAPYDWDSLLEFFAGRAIPGVEEVASGVYRRTISHDGTPRSPGGAPRPAAPGARRARPRRGARGRSCRSSHASAACSTSTRTRRPSRDTCATTRCWATLVRRYPGLRVPGAWEPFEMSVRAVLGESFAGGAGTGLCELVRRFGEPLSVPDAGGLSLVFPSPGALARARLAGLPPDRARLDPIARGDRALGRGRGIADERARRRRIDGAVHRGPGLPAAGRLPLGRSGSASGSRSGELADRRSPDRSGGTLAPVARLRGRLPLAGEHRSGRPAGPKNLRAPFGARSRPSTAPPQSEFSSCTLTSPRSSGTCSKPPTSP